MAYQPRMSTLDRLMAENAQLKAENKLLLQAIGAMSARAEETLILARQIIADLTESRKAVRRDATSRIAPPTEEPAHGQVSGDPPASPAAPRQQTGPR